MNNFYIYKTELNGNTELKSLTVIFNPSNSFNFNLLSNELRAFHEGHAQTDGIVFIFGKDIDAPVETIKNNYSKIFKSIPVVEEKSLKEKAFFIEYDESNGFKIIKDSSTSKYKLEKKLKIIIHQGLQSIFIERGGLVEASGDMHHYVFPSGKHSSKFLRVANVLLYKSEIYFIALALLDKLKGKVFENIYCDTSSINSIAIAIVDLKNRFTKQRSVINVCSFKSYDGLYDKNTTFESNSIYLISASTSGGIINFMKLNHEDIKSEDIFILYFLNLYNDNPTTMERVLCDLTYDKNKNLLGIRKYETFKGECNLCKNGSYPVTISGDIFLLEEPKVNNLLIKTNHISNELKHFVHDFKSNNEDAILKVSYKETNNNISNRKYDVFIDYEKIIRDIVRFKNHREKLDAYINQFVPNNLKYIVHLNDKGSSSLAVYIKDKISNNLKNVEDIKICNQTEVHNFIENTEEGAVLIIGSCISNGKNLLYLSRFLRNFDRLRVIYFVGINRVSNEKDYKELRSNLKYGRYGSDNSTYVEIEKIFCNNSSIDNSWQKERNFNFKIIEDSDDEVVISFFKERNKFLEEFDDNSIKGGSHNIFLPVIDHKSLDFKNGKELKIRKNSAFFTGNGYFNNVSQSDVYFTISNVLNNMRNCNGESLTQSTFVRNLLSPSNFNRFNDGIIQASIIRSAKEEELNYKLNNISSKEMTDIISTIIKYYEQEQGEAVLEFLFALAVGKIRLKKDHYSIINELIKSKENPIFNVYNEAIIANLKKLDS